MPVACGNSVLTGANGSIAFKPAGTTVCLNDFSDFDADNEKVQLPDCHGFVVGDSVQFLAVDGATLDGGITSGTCYEITAIDADEKASLAQSNGTAVTLQGNGGSNGADTPDPAHVEMSLCEFSYVCNLRSVSLNLDREEIDTTSLPCGCSATDCYAPFRTKIGGFVDGSGTAEVMFTEDQSSMANRLIRSSLLKNQDGAEIRFYISHVCENGEVVEADSMYFEAPINILGFSTSITPDDVTVATINFSLSGQPTAVF